MIKNRHNKVCFTALLFWKSTNVYIYVQLQTNSWTTLQSNESCSCLITQPPTLIVSLILLPGFVSPLDFNPECFPPSPVPLRRQPSFHSLPKLIWTLWSNRIRCLFKRLLLQAKTYLVRAFINPELIDYH